MTARACDVAVVGGGPAGLAATRRAVECGARVALVDDNPQPGGQIWRAHRNQRSPHAGLWQSACHMVCGARVIAAPEPGLLTLERADTALELAYRTLVLATGARELFLPFPGWTLPNVMGVGGLQALVKSGFPIEGKTIAIAGTGPLLLAVARYLREHGARIAVVAEQADQAAVLRFGIGILGHFGKLSEAAQIPFALRGVKYATACWPVSAQGASRVESVTLLHRGKTSTVPCDYLACGFGLIPNLELPALLGCRVDDTGVWVDDNQQTSVPGIYAAGETTGIGGLDLALVEGEIAGYASAGKPERARDRIGIRASQRRFAVSLARAFALRAELKQLARPETLVCRCEDVPLARLKPCSGWREAKLQTRCGMGPCQGRICGPAAEFLFDWKRDSVRPPIFPARIASLTGPQA
jgi:NADPH-dependent 2,4-dienoyl-CoA reductase/sulfur reductase-like enzyme